MLSRRPQFVGLLSCLAALYGAVLAYRLFHSQADVISDILKFSVLVFCTTALLSYFWWTLIMGANRVVRLSNISKGALAGLLSAVSIIPVPSFLGGLKHSFTLHADMVLAVQAGIDNVVFTFSLAEFLALPMSAVLGAFVAYR